MNTGNESQPPVIGVPMHELPPPTCVNGHSILLMGRVVTDAEDLRDAVDPDAVTRHVCDELMRSGVTKILERHMQQYINKDGLIEHRLAVYVIGIDEVQPAIAALDRDWRSRP